MLKRITERKTRLRNAQEPEPPGRLAGALSFQSGFTLLELLVSIALIGIIIMIIIGALRLGLRSVESGEKKIELLQRMRNSFNIIDAQIQSQTPLSYEEDGERKYYFRGERTFMQFPTNYSVWGGEKGYVLATYSVLPDESGRQVLYISENVMGLSGSTQTTLFNSFDTIYFEYLYKDPTEESGRWVDTWTDSLYIPEKVRIHLIRDVHDYGMVIPMRVNKSSSGPAAHEFPDEGFETDE